ncbi:MAG: hypothetical protein KJ574_00540 [Nanoarchaeota archaeon]|nr:hypothetical protein [Nanoarchaeota archaeon]
MNSRNGIIENIRLQDDKKYYVFVSVGYSNSQATPSLLTDYAPIHICEELPAHVPDDFVYVPPAETNGDPFARKTSESSDHFYQSITDSGFIQSVFDDLIRRQGSLMVKTFRNSPAFAPQFEKRGVQCFGLTPEQAHRFNSKTEQARILERVLPFPKQVVVRAKDAPSYFTKVMSDRGVFLSREYGGGGSGSRTAENMEELKRHISSFDPEEEIVMAELLSLYICPSIDVMIANPDDILAYGIVDQIFDPDNPLGCRGSIYPSELPRQIKEEIEELAVIGGRRLAEEGLRGYVSFDFNVDDRGRVFFGEVNARYAGSTTERMMMMELTRPSGNPSVMDLERMAIEKGTFAGHRLWREPSGIYFMRREVTAPRDGVIGFEPDLPDREMTLFLERGGGIIGRLEKGASVQKGVSVGKIVSVASSKNQRDRMAWGLDGVVTNMLK